MKKIIYVILLLAMVITLSGCKEVPSFMPSFWDGLTKAGAREYIQGALQDKYGEEFEVISMGIRSGQYYRELVANCSSKSNENIFFQIEANNFGGNRNLYDGYIQSLVRWETKSKIDSVLAKYYDIYASEVYVHGLSGAYDSRILSAKDATIKNYSESLPDSNKTNIWVALNEREIGAQEKISNTVKEMSSDFYLTHAYIHFYYATDDDINRCIEYVDNIPEDRWGVYIILQGHFPYDAFVYDGNDKDNRLVQVEFADNQT